MTATRLYLIESRVGAFKPLYENKAMRVIERSTIQGVHSAGPSLVIATGSEQLRLTTARHADAVTGQALFACKAVHNAGGADAKARLGRSDPEISPDRRRG